jgi:hypothetical protein
MNYRFSLLAVRRECMSPFFTARPDLKAKWYGACGCHLSDNRLRKFKSRIFKKALNFHIMSPVEQTGDTLAEYDFSDLDVLG